MISHAALWRMQAYAFHPAIRILWGFLREQASCRFPVLNVCDFIAVNAEKMDL